MASQTQIATALGFTLDELASNRMGRLTGLQSWRCTQEALSATGLFIATIGIVIAILYLSGWSGVVRGIAVVFAVFGCILAAVFSWNMSRAAFAKHVVAETGALSFEGGRSLSIKVGETPVNVPYAAASALTAGEIYCLYYAKHSNMFLSIEKLHVDVVDEQGAPLPR